MDYDDHEEFIESWIREHLFFRYPEDHFLKQTVCVNITVDTGDENYDYVLNNLYPHYGIIGCFQCRQPIMLDRRTAHIQ